MPRAGLEPATSRSSVSHSPKLSYRGSRGPSVNERNSFCGRGSTKRVGREQRLILSRSFSREMKDAVPPAVQRALRARFPEALDSARRLLRQPSVSATGEGVAECAEMVRQMMAEIGCKTRTWKEGGHRLVLGELDVGAPVALNDYSEDLRGVPTVYLGVKGCLYLTIWSRGNRTAGGPMEGEIYSSDAVWIASPVWRLLQALDTLVDEDQRPVIDGIWDEVRRPAKAEVAMVRRLAKKFDPKTWLREGKVAKFKYDLPKVDLLLRYLYEPTVNICGIHSGYVDHGGTKTILPHEAYAKVDIRLVKDMTVGGTLRKLRAHFAKRGFGDLRIDVHGPYGPARTDPTSWIARAAIETVEAHGKVPEVWPSSGGTMPAFAFDEYLHLPWVATGLGHGAHAHAPNEYASIDGMRRFIAAEATLVYTAAKRGKAVAK